MDPEIVKPKYISMKGHPDFNERWLHEQLIEDPSLLGLGDLDVRDSERSQPSGGRLDLLLVDPDSLRRYEVEVQLGAIDESHLIRTIEYWDIERTRYPQYEHVPVIVAESVTSRFLNVIRILHRSVPLVAIQLQLVEANGAIVPIASTIVDHLALGTEEADEGETVDRSWWERKSSPEALAILDGLIDKVRRIEPAASPKYNKHYVGLSVAGNVRNFASFRPRKSGWVNAHFSIRESDEMTSWLDSTGLKTLAFDQQWNEYRVRVTKTDAEEHDDALMRLLRTAHSAFGRGA